MILHVLKCDIKGLERQDDFSCQNEPKDVIVYISVSHQTYKKKIPVLTRDVLSGQGLKSSSEG